MSPRCAHVVLMAALHAAAPPLSAQWTFGGDLTLSSRYQWRGLTRHDGTVVQPQAYLSRSLDHALVASAGVWTVIQHSRTDPTFGRGLGRTWFGEVSPWVELGATVRGLDLSAGYAAYHFADGADLGGSGRNTSEVYARLTTLELPVVVPRATLWYDAGAVDGAYLETGLAIRVPLWPAVKLPVGSLVLDADLGWNLSQGGDGGDPGYYAKTGLTHADLSAGLATGVFAMAGIEAWMRAEIHHQRNGDARTRQTGDREPHDGVTWFALTISASGPACRPHQEICR